MSLITGPPEYVPQREVFDGPHFICSIECVILEAPSSRKKAEVLANRRFSGGQAQQWMIHSDPNGTGRVSIQPNSSSNDSLRYLAWGGGLSTSLDKSEVWWTLSSETPEDGGRTYRLTTEKGDALALPAPSGYTPCPVRTVRRRADSADNTSSLLILKDTPETRKSLSKGIVGPYAFPSRETYLTVGTAQRFVGISNHLSDKVDIAACVSGSGSSAQYVIQPGKKETWARSETLVKAHVSVVGLEGARAPRVYEVPSGMVLHVAKLPLVPTSISDWPGIEAVRLGEEAYTKNKIEVDNSNTSYIGIENGLEFQIHVSLLGAVTGKNAKQMSLVPGQKGQWFSRSQKELVLVSVGSAPGLPKVFLGLLGSTLHVTQW